MEILSHRGYWKKESEKNSRIAFERSFDLGFGTETDIRDLDGTLVISHDAPKRSSQGLLTVEDFFMLYKENGKNLPLALNIKSDGLQSALIDLIKEYDILNYFVFDMSIPDTIGYIKNGIKFFTRQSEYEIDPALIDYSDGIWMDEFLGHWINEKVINTHLANNRKVCLVSPELHKREYLKEWDDYKKIEVTADKNLMLCTDLPEQAKQYFHNETY